MPNIRLDKYLSDLGIASRRDIKELIRAGRVTVNGCAALPETKLDGESSVVELDGVKLNYARHHYYMMNKPAGVLSVTEDKKQSTVLDLVTPELRRMGVAAVGRLDKDTEGLLLLTDDGDFAHSIISPKSEIEKLYYAVVDGKAVESDILAFRQGIILGDGTKCLPAKLEVCGESECLVCVMEGKYHQVKRMLASRGLKVQRLRRLSIGALKLDESLAPGDFRELTQREIEQIFMAT